MNAWAIFRRARFVLYSFLVLLCFTWAALFAVFLAHEWSYFSEYHQKIVVVCLLSLYGFTAILLYLMAVVHYQFWWDVARIVSLLVVHTGGSAVFTFYRPSLPCLGFGTEASCKEFVSVIFIGCWVFSGMLFCFSITLGVMAFLLRPVEPLSESGEAELPPSPASFKAGSLFSEGRPPSFYSFDPHMAYDDKRELPDESLSLARTPVLVNGAPQEPPRLWQSFQVHNSTDESIYAETMITRTDSPVKSASVDFKSGRQRADSLYLNPPGARSPPPPHVYTPVPETVNEFPMAPPSMPNRLPTIPELMYGARAVTSDTMHRDRAAPYTPTIYTGPTAHSFPTTFRESPQLHQMYPDPAQTDMPRIHSFHSAVASIYSKWAVSPTHVLPPPVLTPGVAYSKHLSELQDLPSAYHAQNTAHNLKRNVSLPNGTVPNHGGGLARRSNPFPVTLPVT